MYGKKVGERLEYLRGKLEICDSGGSSTCDCKKEMKGSHGHRPTSLGRGPDCSSCVGIFFNCVQSNSLLVRGTFAVGVCDDEAGPLSTSIV